MGPSLSRNAGEGIEREEHHARHRQHAGRRRSRSRSARCAEPEPRANEALVAVHAFSLNRGELRLFQVRPEGWRPGQDIAGVVVRAGRGRQRPGGRHARRRAVDWEGWAERAAVPSHRMAALADNVSFGAAASLPVAGLTALRTPAPRRAAARQAGADHRRGGRGRQPRGADGGALRGAGHRGRRQRRARAGPRRARRRRDRHRHRGRARAASR